MAHYKVTCTKEGDEVFNPKSLFQLCMLQCAADVKSAFFVEQGVKNVSKTSVPPEFVEEILEKCDHSMPDYFPMLQELRSHLKLELKRLNLNYCLQLNDSQLYKIMMMVRPVHLEIHGCRNLTYRSIDTINRFGENLTLLNLGDTAPTMLDGASIKYELQTPNVRVFAARKLCFKKIKYHKMHYMRPLLSSFVYKLENLELFDCGGIECFKYLLHAKSSLQFLNLGSSTPRKYPHSVDLKSLLEFRELSFLDLSFCKIEINEELKTDFLEKFASHLSNLQQLNLAGLNVDLMETPEYPVASQGDLLSNIEILPARHPLDCINLYHNEKPNILSRWTKVPARVVVNNEDELSSNLIVAIKNKIGGLSDSQLEALENISKQPAGRFPWTAAMNMVAKKNLDGWVEFGFLNLALNNADKLAKSQLQQIFDLLIKTLNCPQTSNSSFHCGLQLLVWQFMRQPSLLSHKNNVVLISTLVKVGRRRLKDTLKMNKAQDECFYIFSKIGKYFETNPRVITIVRMERELNEEVIALAREVIKFNRPDFLIDLFKNVTDKLTN